MYEQEFIKMIEKNFPLNVWHIGETSRGSCYSDIFPSFMQSLGYKYLIIPAKQISQIDYFVDDRLRGENGTRTAITWFTKGELPSLEEFNNLFGKENLGTYCNLTNAYLLQDCKKMNITRQTIQDMCIIS